MPAQAKGKFKRVQAGSKKGVKGVKGKGKTIQRKRAYAYYVDCSKPVSEKIFTLSSFADYLRLKVKVNNKLNNFGKTLKIVSDKDTGKVGVVSKDKFKKRYLKYLTKRYLKKHQLRDWLRVVALNDKRHKNEYVLKYYAIYAGDDEEAKGEEENK